MLKVPLLTILLSAGMHAQAYTEVAADRLTCAEITKIVEKEQRYYLQTAFDGIIPIYVTIPVSQDPVCGPKLRVWYEIITTSDNPECHVGYNCIPG